MKRGERERREGWEGGKGRGEEGGERKGGERKGDGRSEIIQESLKRHVGGESFRIWNMEGREEGGMKDRDIRMMERHRSSVYS